MAGQPWPAWVEGGLIYLGALLAWGMGLYLLTRGGARRLPLLAAAATVVLVVYQLGQALGALSESPARWLAWTRGTWWAAAVAPGVWVTLVLTLAYDEAPPGRRRLTRQLAWALTPLALTLGLVFAALGSMTDLVVRWDTPASPQGVPFVPPGPLFGLYQGFVAASVLGMSGLLLFLWRCTPRGEPLHARFGWLGAAAAMFLLGGLYITLASGLAGYSGLPGQLLLTAGLLLMGWNMARYGALLAGETVGADVAAFGVATGTLALGYGLAALTLLPRFDGWYDVVLPGLLVLITTHVLAGNQNRVLDLLIYGRTTTAVRRRLRVLSDRVARQPDELAALAEVQADVARLVEEQTAALSDSAGGESAGAGSAGSNGKLSPSLLRVQVESALRHLNDLPHLAGHPLSEQVRPDLAGAPPLERARQLRLELAQAVERLKPAGTPPTPGGSLGPGAWLHYLILREAYVDGRPNKQVMTRYYLSESSFHRARRRAIDVLADDLAGRLGSPAA